MSERGIHADPDKVAVVVKWRETRSFLSLANPLEDFSDLYAHLAGLQ